VRTCNRHFLRLKAPVQQHPLQEAWVYLNDCSTAPERALEVVVTVMAVVVVVVVDVVVVVLEEEEDEEMKAADVVLMAASAVMTEITVPVMNDT
jgi:hypothetical protein